MYTPDERALLRATLVETARADSRITGAALTGSAASGAEDRWSDIDLAFGVTDGDLARTIADWTALMYRQHRALAHFDVLAGATTYRVFLLESTLQVDIAFSPGSDFGAISEATFRLLFGTAVSKPMAQPPNPASLIGMAWLYALHARSSIARGRSWQAEYMISGVRDHALALACLRHGLPAVQGRGMDRLPEPVSGPIAAALVRSLDPAELRRAFRAATTALLAEVGEVDRALAARLEAPLTELTGGA